MDAGHDSIRAFVVNCLRELPSKTVVLKLLDGNPPRTAQDVINMIENRDPIGLDYTEEVMRVARDLIIRQAKK